MKQEAENTNTGAEADPITYTSDADGLTVRITGEAFANLKAIAEVMNAVTWGDHDNTPLSVFRGWAGELIERAAIDPAYYGNVPITSLADIIANAVEFADTGCDEGTPEDKARRDELLGKIRARFNA